MHRRLFVKAISVAAIVSLSAGQPAQAQKKAAEEQTGIKVGAKAPAFKLSDQAGKQRSLDELTEDGTVALVFFRSASW
jgi:cytochrome oxidase Cu insertion factor (SCO1/SenC/PrrC family)